MLSALIIHQKSEPLPSLRMLIGCRQDGQQQQQHWQYRYNVEDQDWPGPVDPNSDCGSADNPFTHVHTEKRLYNYAAWKCDCQLDRTGQWKGRKLNCINIFLLYFIFYVYFWGLLRVKEMNAHCKRNTSYANEQKWKEEILRSVKFRNISICLPCPGNCPPTHYQRQTSCLRR